MKLFILKRLYGFMWWLIDIGMCPEVEMGFYRKYKKPNEIKTYEDVVSNFDALKKEMKKKGVI